MLDEGFQNYMNISKEFNAYEMSIHYKVIKTFWPNAICHILYIVFIFLCTKEFLLKSMGTLFCKIIVQQYTLTGQRTLEMDRHQ